MTLVKKKRRLTSRKAAPSLGSKFYTVPPFKDVWGIEEPVEPPKKKVIKEEPIKEKPIELDQNDLRNWASVAVLSELRRSDFPLCCGMQIINNFPYQTGKIDTYGMLKGDGDSSLNSKKVPEDVVKDYVQEELRKQMKNVSQGMVIVLNSFQTPHFEEVVLNCGFKKIVEPFLYTGHGRDLTMYFCHPTRGKTLSKSTF